MSLPPPGTYDIGPDTGALLVSTGREGVASRVGHDLTVTFTDWSGSVIIGGAGAAIDVTIETGSFDVIEGRGGVTPLSGLERREIARTARRLLDVGKHPQARFVSTSVSPDDAGGGTVEGTVSIRGRSTPIVLEVTRGDTAWHVEATLLQSSVGITPYSAFLGTLRVADRVTIAADVTLPAAEH